MYMNNMLVESLELKSTRDLLEANVKEGQKHAEKAIQTTNLKSVLKYRKAQTTTQSRSSSFNVHGTSEDIWRTRSSMTKNGQTLDYSAVLMGTLGGFQLKCCSRSLRCWSWKAVS